MSESDHDYVHDYGHARDHGFQFRSGQSVNETSEQPLSANESVQIQNVGLQAKWSGNDHDQTMVGRDYGHGKMSMCSNVSVRG